MSNLSLFHKNSLLSTHYSPLTQYLIPKLSDANVNTVFLNFHRIGVNKIVLAFAAFAGVQVVGVTVNGADKFAIAAPSLAKVAACVGTVSGKGH